MSKHAVSKPQLFFGLLLIIVVASMAVIAETLNSTNDTTSTATSESANPTDASIATDTTTIDAAQAPQRPDLPPSMERITACHTTTWEEPEPTWANCTVVIPTTTCTDVPANKSCSTTSVTQTYLCINGSASVQHQRTDCTTTGFRIDNAVVLNTTGYNCSLTDAGKLYVTCDSIYDGNGDGICTSGESCIQFGIVGNFVTRKERNSRNDWLDKDPSYVIATPEVPQ